NTPAALAASTGSSPMRPWATAVSAANSRSRTLLPHVPVGALAQLAAPQARRARGQELLGVDGQLSQRVAVRPGLDGVGAEVLAYLADELLEAGHGPGLVGGRVQRLDEVEPRHLRGAGQARLGQGQEQRSTQIGRAHV